MDRTTFERNLQDILFQSPEGRRRRKAQLDVVYLFSHLLKGTLDPQLKPLLFKAHLFECSRSLEPVACVVCGGVPEADWKALGTDPAKTGMHCAAHKAEFHSVCGATYNCCEPYDPDRVYEWRPENALM